MLKEMHLIPTIGLVIGDPTGIGPELVARLLQDEDALRDARVVVIGNPELLELGLKTIGVRKEVPVFDADSVGNAPIAVLQGPRFDLSILTPGKVQVEAGQFSLDCFGEAFKLFEQGLIEAIVYAPINKEAVVKTGCAEFHDPLTGDTDELQLFVNKLHWRHKLFGELNVVDDLWTGRVTSHIPLSAIVSYLTVEGILNAIRLMDTTLKTAGVDRPIVAVSALNPHGGEHGLVGREEIDIIEPAIREAQRECIDARGPFPADTVFVRVRRDGYHAVVSMYHDQGQIAMKLLGFPRGVTVPGGLPMPFATPSHGTAHDIAGKGVADVGAMRAAFVLGKRMAQTRLRNTQQ